MLDFLATFTNTDLAAFPDTKAVDSSGGASTDGTEFIANMVNDSLWGWQQALLSFNSMSPNGIVESVANSQIIKAMQKFTIPGMVIPVAWNDDPVVLGIRAIIMHDQGILRANYPDLDAAVYVGDANNGSASAFYRADDAAGVTPNIAGAYLILPDTRGQVVRGLDVGATVDPDGASRDLGSLQEDAMQRITGFLPSSPSITGLSGAFSLGSGSSQTALTSAVHTGQIIFNSAGSVTPNLAKTDDIESRMTNIALDYMITY